MWYEITAYIQVIFIFISHTVCIGSTGEYKSKNPLWTWECLDNRCVPSSAHRAEKIQSLEMCTMLCAEMQLWPLPTGLVSLSSTAVPVRADLTHLEVVSAPSKLVVDHLVDAFDLLQRDLRYLEANAAGHSKWRSITVYITVNGSGDPRLLMNTDESYSLIVYPKLDSKEQLSAKIYAKSFCGARHALETFEQLIWFDPVERSLYMLEAAKIEDKPQFSYRGLLLDTARNYITVPDIIRTIDAMAASKLNTFHWHVSDSESFPLKLSSAPRLSLFGAYGTNSVYTTEDVREIVHRARLRGIRVLIEIDTPAHVGRSWIQGEDAGLGELVICTNLSQWKEMCSNPPCGQLNPQNYHVFDLLEAIYKEIVHLTGVDDVIHIGGDGISSSCWKKHFPDRDTKNILQEYTQMLLSRLVNINEKLPNLILMWTSPLSEHLKTDFSSISDHLGLQTRNVDSLINMYLNGIRIVISHQDPWDLNGGMGEWYEDTAGMAYNSWQRMYEYRPWARSNKDNIIGGEVTAWTSMLSLGGVDGRVWPRAAAFAERVWTDRVEGATRAVHARLDRHRQRLLARGIHAAPLWSMWCSHYTYTCS